MNVSKLVCAALALAAFASEGATIYSKGSGSEPSVMSSSIWSNNKAPEAGNDYVCQRTVHTDGVTEPIAGGVTLLTFPGDSLTMQRAGDNVADFLVDSTYQGSNWLNFPRGGFIMEGDVNFRFWSADKANYTINITGGCFTVKAPYRDGIPSIRGMSQGSDYTSTYVFHLPFKGDADAVLAVNHHKSGYPGAGRLEFVSDASEFLGTISLDYNNSVGIYGVAFGGTIDLAGSSSFLTFGSGADSDVSTVACVTSEVANAKLQLVGKASAEIGSLTFPGGRIEIPNVVENGKYAGGSISVTDCLDLASQAQITVVVPGEVIPQPEEGDSRTNEFVVLSAPQSAGRLSPTDFILSVTECTGTTQGDVALAVRVDEVTGLQQLIVRRRNVSVVTQRNSDTSGGSGIYSFVQANNWTDDKLPHPGADYLVPTGNQVMTRSGAVNYFKGETLDLPGKFVFNAKLVNSGFITIHGQANSYNTIRTFSANSELEGGVVEIRKDSESARQVSVLCSSDGGNGLVLNSELCGNGILAFQHSGDTATHTAVYRLGGMSHHFEGRIWTEMASGKSWNSSTMKRITLEFTDPSNFGDRRTALEDWALKPTDAFVLSPTRTMTFTSTRSAATFQGNVNFRVNDGIYLNFCHRYTFYQDAILHKTGAGTLGLGGDLRFISGSSRVTSPTGSESLMVEEGWVQPLSEVGGDGLIYTFSEGAGIRLRSGLAADDPVHLYGLKDVKRSVTFKTATTDGKIAVAIDGLTPKTREKLAVLTVNNHDKAVELKDKLVFANDGVEGVGATFSVRDNEDGSSTVEVQCVSTLGLMLIFR